MDVYKDEKERRWERKVGLMLLALYLASAVCCAFFRELINTDEVWNFTFGANVARGLLPYRDFNYLQTPFSAFVNGLLFRIFGTHIIVMRMAGAVLFTAIAMCLYRNSRMSGAAAVPAALPGFAAIYLFSTNIFFEYSDFILFLLILLMGLDLKAVAYTNEGIRSNWMRFSYQLACGILGGLAILSKQTYGTFVCLASWLCAFLICVLNGKTRREARRVLLFRVIGSAIPCLIFLVYLLMTETFDDFWDMCVMGIGNFSSYYHYTDLFKESVGDAILCTLLPAGLVLGAILMIVDFLRGHAGKMRSRQEKEQMGLTENVSAEEISPEDVPAEAEAVPETAVPAADEKSAGELAADHQRLAVRMMIALVYCCFGLINMVPLANLFHVTTSAIPVMVVAELIVLHLPKKIYGVLAIPAAAGSGALLALMLILNPVNIVRDLDLHTDIASFEYTFISDSLADEIAEVDDFILKERAKGNEVYVVDNKAGFYNNPLGIYHKYLDMFLTGNLGTATPLECLEKSYSENSVYLFPGEGRSNTQYPTEAVQEFKQKLFLTGHLGTLDVYRTEPDQSESPVTGQDEDGIIEVKDENAGETSAETAE